MNTPLGAEPKARTEVKTTGGRDRRATLQRLRQKENGSQSGNVFHPSSVIHPLPQYTHRWYTPGPFLQRS